MPSAGLARNSIYFQLSITLFLTNHILKKIDQVKLKGSILLFIFYNIIHLNIVCVNTIIN